MDIKTIAAAIVRHALTVGAGALATHGIITGGQTETLVSAGMAVAGMVWSLWDKVGRAAVLAELDVLRARIEAHTRDRQAKAAAIRAPLVMLALILPALAVMLAAPAMAQTRLAVRAEDRAGPVTSEPGGSTGAIKPDDLWGKIQAAKREDLVYARALADAAGTDGGKLRAACWGAWIDLIDMQQGANVKGPDGQPLGPMPDPHLFSKFEQLAQLADALQPNAPFMAKCSPVAQGLKMRVLDLVGKVVGGGFSLGTLVPGL